MKGRSYKEQIARRLTLVTALIVMVVFAIIYLVVSFTVVQNIDKELELETQKHVGQIFLENGVIKFMHKDEWQEQEHQQIQLNPIFIEIVDLEGNSMDKSPNLRNNRLKYFPGRGSDEDAWTIKIGDQEVRQKQILLKNKGELEGYLLVATSFEDASELLSKLRLILLVLYPGILISLYLIMLYLAGKSIQPIQKIIHKTNQITQSSLDERVPILDREDEIGQLTRSINELLDRLEQSMIREKQFTSDASHELRTPLSVLRGTLEVLIRKPRTSEQYVEKIQTALTSIDRMSSMIDQLLALARVEKANISPKDEVEIISFVEELADQAKLETGRDVQFIPESSVPIFVHVSEKSLQMILNNLIQNAVKYTQGTVNLVVGKTDREGYILVKDEGPGISQESLSKIFDPFYRDPEVLEKVIPGTGLGLAIVKKLALETGVKISVMSDKEEGSTFRLTF
ncbi:sensor histidine kinase [Algoriphagus machipongonensis]|uniref:histidine kinase n=1 Tax=Algoriphagus machipongonensis TaxID=388413 RepID=A3I2F6_9BACT|nr:ATP-binding protein [Algoriphagus machipongonensis]EAZ79260.1 periplasmic sensor signal transduction histidine kinase [Algoriphagus machipongonensis]